MKKIITIRSCYSVDNIEQTFEIDINNSSCIKIDDKTDYKITLTKEDKKIELIGVRLKKYEDALHGTKFFLSNNKYEISLWIEYMDAGDRWDCNIYTVRDNIGGKYYQLSAERNEHAYCPHIYSIRYNKNKREYEYYTKGSCEFDYNPIGKKYYDAAIIQLPEIYRLIDYIYSELEKEAPGITNFLLKDNGFNWLNYLRTLEVPEKVKNYIEEENNKVFNDDNLLNELVAPTQNMKTRIKN